MFAGRRTLKLISTESAPTPSLIQKSEYDTMLISMKDKNEAQLQNYKEHRKTRKGWNQKQSDIGENQQVG